MDKKRMIIQVDYIPSKDFPKWAIDELNDDMASSTTASFFEKGNYDGIKSKYDEDLEEATVWRGLIKSIEIEAFATMLLMLDSENIVVNPPEEL